MIRPVAYIGHPGFSQSDMKIFKESPLMFKTQIIDGQRSSQVENDSTDMGNLVDAICTNPEGLKDYYIAEEIECSDSQKEIVKDTVAKINELLNHPETKLRYNVDAVRESFKAWGPKVEKIMLAMARQRNYRSNYGDAALLKDLQHAKNFYVAYYANGGKPIIDINLYRTAERNADKVFHHPVIGRLFRKDSNLEPGERVVFQQMHTWDTNLGFYVKILPDLYIINDELKYIKPFDIKTAFSIRQFKVSYYKLDYGNQGATYKFVLQQNYPDYKIDDFRFIVVPVGSEKQENKEPACLYRMSHAEETFRLKGGVINGYEIPGVLDTIDRIGWHYKTGQWDYPKEYYDNFGELIIDTTSVGDSFNGQATLDWL